jgi:uncharacterized protein
MAESLPLFPLRTVLFPGGLLPLRIFEPRYIDMIGHCMREGGEFGVVLVAQGDEVGEVTHLAPVGCSARIVDFEQLPDGLLGIMCRGDRRFHLHGRRTQDDGLNIGDIDWLIDGPDVPLGPEHQALGRVLRRVIGEYGDLQRFIQPDFDHASWVSYRLAELLPLSKAMQQSMLEMADPMARLEQLAPMVEVP